MFKTFFENTNFLIISNKTIFIKFGKLTRMQFLESLAQKKKYEASVNNKFKHAENLRNRSKT